ncbi:signal transduction histidine kinase CheA [Oleiphilus messinensis]|uniref:Chemotaxis protein CheA n=1 Tax=Oleiphilus messinensis TaxID=141451 RepID=A0A1Y0IFT4_9GAMM|nr:chemotaxis protein CheA [Oleiphilus messinensis]ARU59388.1 signal transduction histidine kinase CheA [Oleiphilus messinensis]
MNVDSLVETFVEESTELLQEYEASLLTLESQGFDSESVGQLFRAAHTIKGSAGVVGMEHVVGFTHVTENVLSRLREQEIGISPQLIDVLLRAGDFISRLIDCALHSQDLDAEHEARGHQLIGELKIFLGESAGQIAPVTPIAPVNAAVDAGQARSVPDCWHLSIRFSPDSLRNGIEPTSFIAHLQTLGEVVKVVTVPDSMPEVDTMDPETCYLGFEVALRTDCDRDEIVNVFELAGDHCELHLMPPGSKIDDYLKLIDSLPECNLRLGEILVACNALSREELARILDLQSEEHETESAKDQPQNTPPRIGEMLVERGDVPQKVIDAAVNKQLNRDASNLKTIKLPAHRLDELINLVGELVIATAGNATLAQQFGQSDQIEAAAHVSSLVEEIRSSALQLRMVPIGDTFSRFTRVVRDVSAELGKQIRLSISGGETELDKSVVEKIADPLMHLVRNAMDHGIETAEQRIQAGKSEAGSLHLNAYHESGSVVIEVMDDGGGLDVEKIRAKAISNGLISADDTLSEAEIFNLIMEPGFSTKEQISNLSGRGVGMDVVRRNIESLRGTIELSSKLGQGTTMRIRLPLTLAIIDGFMVQCVQSTYVIPLDMIVECVELETRESENLKGNDYINLRGEVLPFLRLRDLFGARDIPQSRESIVVIQYGGKRAGLLVDRLLGEFQTVIKPLGPLFGNLQGVSGSTILGSGEVALILDVPALVSRIVNMEQQTYMPRIQGEKPSTSHTQPGSQLH